MGCMGSERALVKRRIDRRMKDLGLKSYNAYLRYIKQDKSENEIILLLNEISTNVTSFFREPKHFKFISQVIRRWHNEGQKRFRFWCAACSTGEEPYSLAMTVAEALDINSLDIKILATDISTKVLEKCQEGIQQWNSQQCDGDEKYDPEGRFIGCLQCENTQQESGHEAPAVSQ